MQAQEEPEKPLEDAAPPAQPPVDQKAPSPEKSINGMPKEETMDDENMELDFEEISEDELEEEARIKGIGDALGVDWSSLVAESRPRIKPISSAKIRWESHNVLVNLGVSVEMVGEKLFEDILKEHRQSKESQSQISVKAEPTSPCVNGIADVKKEEEETNIRVKEEPEEQKQMEIDDLNNLHPVAAIQVAVHENQTIRKTLFSSAGPYRRALSARRDLVIRRHMCNLPITDTFVEAPKRHDPELYKLAAEIFERCL